MHEDWLSKSVPIKLSSVMVGHAIHQDRDEVSFFNLLDNFNFGLTLTATYLFSFIAILMICFLIHLINHRIRFGKRGRTSKTIQKVFSALGTFRGSRLSTIGLFVLCVHLFLWQTQLFLTNNIKVSYFDEPFLLELSIDWKWSYSNEPVSNLYRSRPTKW